jgi:hypothetical protein
MVYVVERYMPGVAPPVLVSGLDRLARMTEKVRNEGTIVRYLGSTIVPEDEACFCQFDAPSEAAVAEVNRRAGLRFDRIVAALAVPAPDEGRETP